MENNISKEVFDSWINSHKNENTKKAYKRIVPQFFQITLNKDIADVTKADLDGLIPIHVSNSYISYMMNNVEKNSTLNNYLAIIVSFFNYLSVNKIFPGTDFKYITESCLKGNMMKDDTESRVRMTEVTYLDFKDYLLNLKFSKRYKGKNIQYALALEVMWVTGTRLSAVFEKLKWSDIVWTTDSYGNEGWTILVMDKGDVLASNPISDDLYERLQDNLYDEDEGLVFKDLSKRSFSNYMNEFSELRGIEKLTCHSIRVGAASKLYSINPDILMVSRFLNHADISTTQKYIRTDDNRINTGSYILSKNVDVKSAVELPYDVIKDILIKRKDLAQSLLLEAEKMGHSA